MEQGEQVETASRKPPLSEFDERRLALEFERVKLDRQRANVELRLKRRELDAAKTRGWKNILANPLTLAIVGGFITIMTTTIGGHFTASENISAETAKARQALQADLIKKFVENPNPQTVRANLRFLVDVGLVPDYAASLQSFLAKNPDSALPSSFNPGTSALQNLHTDDDAIDLVLRFEGGFSNNSADAVGATNFGITLAALGSYLGRDASPEELRSLSVETARDIYKRQYLIGGASALASVQVKAAYLGLATNMGTSRASRLFQAAVGSIDHLPVIQDGVLGPASIQRINAIEPDLLIETVNCEAAKYYKSLPQFDRFGRVWMQRLRTFSPPSLKGICAELQAVPNSTDPTQSNR